jgi:hypothetical protein
LVAGRIERATEEVCGTTPMRGQTMRARVRILFAPAAIDALRNGAPAFPELYISHVESPSRSGKRSPD